MEYLPDKNEQTSKQTAGNEAERVRGGGYPKGHVIVVHLVRGMSSYNRSTVLLPPEGRQVYLFLNYAYVRVCMHACASWP